MKKDLTEGSVFRTLVYFSLPFLFSCFLQVLYGLADLFIIGRFNGTASITAVSIGSQIIHMLTVMIVGLAMGVTVSIGRAFGARNKKETSRAIGNTIVLFAVGAAVLTAFLLMFVRPITALMSTPGEAVDGTIVYLTICFAGIPFITAYNVLGSVFRGLGDSRSPMYFIIVACFCNIVLDYLFIGAFHMGPAGAALGTTLAQTISVAVSAVSIRRRDMGVQLRPEDFRLSRRTVSRILRVGVPIAMQDGFIQISFLIITVFANSRGLDDAAAVGIVEKIICFLFLVPSSMLSAVSALAALNFGAGKPERARSTLLCALGIVVGFGTVTACVTQFIAPQMVGIFERSENVIRLGSQYLHAYVWDCIFAGVHFCFSGYFCAKERSGLSFLHNALSIVLMRIPLSWFASTYYKDTLFPMGLAAPAGSLMSVMICVIAYRILEKKERGEAVETAGTGFANERVR